MAGKKRQRQSPQGFVPLVSVEGSAYDCGLALGYTWRHALTVSAQHVPDDAEAWWATRRRPYRHLLEKHAPHLPDVFRGLAKGAGLPEKKISVSVPRTRRSACTSFAIQPKATLDGHPISGQTKDTGIDRAYLYVVLRMKINDAPSALTLTYPGWLFGHGFVAGGCSIFRNSMYAGDPASGLPFDVWGLLTLHCPTVEDAVKMTRDHGVRVAGHCTVADEHGDIAGFEVGRGGVAVLRPKHGIYTHANAAVSGNRLRRYEEKVATFSRAGSLNRQTRLRARLEADAGQLTAPLAYMAMCDHGGTETVCRHQGPAILTSAAVVAEPTRGLLHVCRGCPCENWPRTYVL